MTDTDIAEIWELLKRNSISFTEIALILKFKQIADDTKPLQKEKEAYLKEVEAELSNNKNIVFNEKAEVIVSYNIKTYEIVLYAFKSNLILDDVTALYYFKTVDLTNLNFDNKDSVHLEALRSCKAKTIILKNAIVQASDIRRMFSHNEAVKILIENCQFPNTTDMSRMFALCNELKEIKIINTSFPKAEKAQGLFDYNSNMKSIDISFLEQSHNLIDVNSIFNNCTNLEEIKGLDKIDTSNIEDLSSTFRRCYKIKKLDLSTWRTEKCQHFNAMFMMCKELEYLNIKQFIFNMTSGEEVVNHTFSMHSVKKCEVVLNKKIRISDCSDKDIAAILGDLSDSIENKEEIPDVYEKIRYSDSVEAFNRLISGIKTLVGTTDNIQTVRCKDKAEYKEITDQAKTKASIFDSEFRDCKLCGLYISNEKVGKVVTIYTLD